MTQKIFKVFKRLSENESDGQIDENIKKDSLSALNDSEKSISSFDLSLDQILTINPSNLDSIIFKVKTREGQENIFMTIRLKKYLQSGK